MVPRTHDFMSTPALSPRPRDTAHPSRPRVAAKPRPIATATATRTPSTTVPPLTPRRMNEFKVPSLPTQEQPSSSPNYFGLAVDTNTNADFFTSSAAQHIRGNWSPPSSNVRSTAAASPHVIPVDQNPDFEQFRRQSENNRAFALGKLDLGAGTAASQPSPTMPQGSVFGTFKTTLPPDSMDTTAGSKTTNGDVKTAASLLVKPRSPKRLLSTESQILTDRPRRNSPASFEGFGRTDQVAHFIEQKNPRPSLPPKKSSQPKLALASHRGETLPASISEDNKTNGPVLATPEHIINILESADEEVLLLDLRVSTQYARARIAGALSLCIPTTLLKRPSFNTQKLAETFKEDELRQKFELWRSCKHIIVYDSCSAQMKDATTCINTLKKFTTEHWTGGSYIIKGGFEEFVNKFPSWVTNGPITLSTSAAPSLHLDSLPAVAPVIGGCPMPATQNAANPFFGNIRQNMDLIGGVGQMALKHPTALTQQTGKELPVWLQEAAAEGNKGKLVSDKFLHIEKREQKRMQEALSSNVVYESTNNAPSTTKSIQLAGLEKGPKNRYNSIWPYEHSRVKLQGVADGACDYVNANHIQAAWTNKRYIATQGPLPATFNDFWNVVWQQDVRVIVMLTAEQEGGQLKAHNYWSSKQYGPLHLKALGERRASLEPGKIRRRERDQPRPTLGQRRSTNPPKLASLGRQPSDASPNAESPYVIVRKFTLENSAEPFARIREITQLQYSNWPDFGAPAHPAHLLGLVEQCDSVVRQVNGGSPSRPDSPESRPVLVHCSAGCGRTGTFCTVDSVLDMLKRQRQARNARQGTPMDIDRSASFQGSPMQMGSPAQSMPQSQPQQPSQSTVEVEGSWTQQDDIDLIEKTVESFRNQRLSMVQSLRQYVLCYESVLEWLVEQQPQSA
ncbi:tyrosine-protein phosphatase non-receptor type 6 [Massariosphaeria phaeospora]|uniref:protein-tyrosine-phosphatase n=1 Tax=Massariosphaeria phaeospora TaxID=100035 RepID=A0A7C8M2F9_9PLEO|nr:tyrosine-protein phosphatase non-receptor type 6 [Massariosphaeria phaeospora]